MPFQRHAHVAGSSCCEAEDEGDVLWSSLDVPRVTALAEAVDGACRVTLFKPWSARAERAGGPARSLPGSGNDDGDDGEDGRAELLLSVPFLSPCRVRSVCVSASAGRAAPRLVRVWADRPGMTFADADDGPPPGAELHPGEDGDAACEQWRPLPAVKFGAASSVQLLLRGGGAHALELFYVGFRGDASGHRRAPVVAVYEARALPGDHAAGEAARGAAAEGV